MKLTDLVEVRENELIAKVPLKIIIDQDEHKELEDQGDVYRVMGLVDICDMNDHCMQTPFLFMVNIPKTSSINIDKNIIEIEFEPDDVIMKAEFKEAEGSIQTIKAILENRIPYMRRNISQQLEILYKSFADLIGHINILYLEIILSELYRCPEDPSLPARLCVDDYSKADPVDIKKAVHLRGNLLRNVAHGYTKEGIANYIVSHRNSNIDRVIEATQTKDQGE